MARLPRIVVPNQPLHIMHRGNNRQDIFESEADLTRIKEDIEHSLLKSGYSLHAYVIKIFKPPFKNCSKFSSYC